MTTPENTPTPKIHLTFISLQVIAKGHLLLKNTPTQQTKTKGSSMHKATPNGSPVSGQGISPVK